MMKKFIAILFVSAATFSSCYYDKEEDLFPSAACDVTGVTYAATVQPLLQSNGCISCHSGSAPSGNISLSGYSNVKILATNGKLYGSINHSAGYSAMPKGGSKMNACNINRIKAWIDAGTPEN
jgi:hypothetical protein